MKHPKKSVIIFVFLFLILTPCMYAFFPRIVTNLKNSETNPIVIERPTIATAYYGALNGTEDYYVFSLTHATPISVMVLTPDAPGTTRHQFSFEIFTIVNDTRTTVVVKTNGSETPYFDQWTNTAYLIGPSASVELPKGTYKIRVFNEQQRGTYVLVVGNETSMAPHEIIETVLVIPTLKEQVFGRHLLFELIQLFTTLGGALFITNETRQLFSIRTKRREVNDENAEHLPSLMVIVYVIVFISLLPLLVRNPWYVVTLTKAVLLIAVGVVEVLHSRIATPRLDALQGNNLMILTVQRWAYTTLRLVGWWVLFFLSILALL